MYVCVCYAITDGQIRDAVRDGARNLRQLRATMPLGSGCGRCVASARQIVSEQKPLATARPATSARVPAPRSLACQDA